MSDTVIQVEELWKEYRLGIINHHTVNRDLQSWWARVRGKEDPNSPIGYGPFQPEDRFWALKDVSFEVKQGDILGIIGRNGAGKSTLLKILSQVTAPTKGEVRFKGRIASLLEVGTGFHPELTGRENIFLNGAILGMSKADIRKKLDEIVAFAEVEKFIDTPVKRYSSGMYVRLAFAVAAHLEPEILIVDEVLAVGDVQFQKKCLGKMKQVGKDGRTVLFVSHNMPAITRLSQRALWINKGKIIADGPSELIVENYLKKHTVSEGQIAIASNSGKPMCLRSLKIIDGCGKISSQVEMARPFDIRVEYDINCAVTGSHVICFIHTHDGVNILGSGDADCSPERLLEKREPGRYSGEFQIPASLLGEGHYLLTVSLGIPFIQVFDRHEDILAFDVVDLTSKRREWQHKRRPGILGIEIPWQLEKLE